MPTVGCPPHYGGAMVEVRLYAIGIDEVRDWFGAGPAGAATLRGVAAERFRVPAAEQRPTGMLSKLGPLFRRDPWAPHIPVDLPTPADVEMLINAHFVPPERLGAAWTVVRAWLDELSWGHVVTVLGATEWRDLEFDLARAGLPSQFAISKLWNLDPALPLRPVPGTAVGYARHHHAVATREALGDAWQRVTDPSREPLHDILGFLRGLDGWTAMASAAGRPAPDVVGVCRT